MKKSYSLAPAAALAAAGLFFCTLFALPAGADERRDALSGVASQAKAEYEQAQQAQQQLEQQQQEYEQQLAGLQGQAAALAAQLQTVYAALQSAQRALDEATAAEAAAELELAQKQAEYDARLDAAKQQMGAMQLLDGGGAVALMAQAKSLYQLLTFEETLRQLSAQNSATLAALNAQAAALEAQRQQAADAAAQLADAKAALDRQQAELEQTQGRLAQALGETDAALSDAEAAAQAQALATGEAKQAYEEATAALDAYVRAQSKQYTTAEMTCSLDFRCPLDSYGAITTQFMEPDPWGIPHRGTDFSAPGGTPLYAVADGVVSAASAVNSYGNCVQISHGADTDGNRYDTLYAHMSRMDVSVDQAVTKGQCIGAVGNTGNVYGANGGYHLHLELRVNGARVNPLGYIPH